MNNSVDKYVDDNDDCSEDYDDGDDAVLVNKIWLKIIMCWCDIWYWHDVVDGLWWFHNNLMLYDSIVELL